MSSTLRAAAAADQSRPTQTRETKNFGSLFRRLTIQRGSSSGGTNHATLTDGHSSNMAATSSTEGVSRKQLSSPSFRRRNVPAQTGPLDSSTVMGWLQHSCPQDLIPRVLAYSGPQTISALSLTCRFWKETTDKESTWRTLCEELYKVRSLSWPAE